MSLENERIDQLERTVLELGTEIFQMKNSLMSMKEYHEKFIEIVEGLKRILDDKGLINQDDFDAAIDLGKALSLKSNPYDHSIDLEREKIKKTSH